MTTAQIWGHFPDVLHQQIIHKRPLHPQWGTASCSLPPVAAILRWLELSPFVTVSQAITQLLKVPTSGVSDCLYWNPLKAGKETSPEIPEPYEAHLGDYELSAILIRTEYSNSLQSNLMRGLDQQHTTVKLKAIAGYWVIWLFCLFLLQIEDLWNPFNVQKPVILMLQLEILIIATPDLCFLPS